MDEIAYSDDAAFPILEEDALSMEPKGKRTMETIYDTFTRFGLTINFGIGKSEAVFTFVARTKTKRDRVWKVKK